MVALRSYGMDMTCPMVEVELYFALSNFDNIVGSGSMLARLASGGPRLTQLGRELVRKMLAVGDQSTCGVLTFYMLFPCAGNCVVIHTCRSL
jgi:hypothetical protein